VERFGFGDALIVTGLAMIVFSLFLAFLMYAQLSNQGPQIPSSTPSNVSVSSAVSVLINNLTQTLNSESYLMIKIVIFFFIASVGFKFAKLGMEMNKSGDEEEEQQGKKGSKGLTNPY
jgi:ABC-type uncharacterized transport system permease subunit